MQRWPFVGRADQLQRVIELCADDEPRAVVLAGLAGVGKTRLAREAGEASAARGRPVVWAMATRSASSVPLGALEPVLVGSIDDAPFRRLVAARSRVPDADPSARLLVVVDDAHLLDGVSASLLQQAAMAGQVDVLATLRTGENVPDPVMAMWKEDWGERIDVAPLERGDMGRLLAAVLGGPVDEAAEHKLWTESQGNVLYLRELVLGAEASGVLALRAGRWRLSGSLPKAPRLIELVEARLAVVGRELSEALERLAIAEVLSVESMTALIGPAGLARLESDGVVETRLDGRRQQVRLAHPLYGEVLRRRTTAVAGRRFRAELADEIDAVGGRRQADLLRASTWRIDGGGPVNAERLLNAAKVASDLDDRDLADRLAGEAYKAGAGILAAVIQGVCALEAGDYVRADALFAPLADQASTEEEVFRIAHGHAHALCMIGRPRDALATLERAMDRVESDMARFSIANEMAVLHDLAGDPRRGLAVLEPALADPTRRAFYREAETGATAAASLGQIGRALELFEQGIAQFADKRLPGTTARMRAPAAAALLDAGRLDDAQHHIDRGVATFVALDGPGEIAVFLRLRGALELLRGRVGCAADAFAEAVVQAHLHNDDDVALGNAGGLAIALAQQGRPQDAAAALAPYDAADPLDPANIDLLARGRAWAAAADGDVRSAIELLRAAAGVAAERGRLTLEATLRHDLARLGEATTETDRLAALATEIGPLGRVAAAQAAHAAALAASDGAALDDAGVELAALGLHLWAAEAAAAANRLYQAASLRRAAAASERFEAQEREQCEGALTPGLRQPAAPVPLSAREHEVAELAARGMSSRAIGERLFVSPRTVENHLQRVYEKLGVANRAELATALELPPA